MIVLVDVPAQLTFFHSYFSIVLYTDETDGTADTNNTVHTNSTADTNKYFGVRYSMNVTAVSGRNRKIKRLFWRCNKCDELSSNRRNVDEEINEFNNSDSIVISIIDMLMAPKASN